MHKLIKILLAVAMFLVALPAYAANLSVDLEQPKTPWNQGSVNLNFVTLDILNRAVTVKCFKNGPGDAGYSQFGADIVVADGGNSGFCSFNFSAGEGNYHFYVNATAGGDTIDSGIATVDYKTGGPGAPINYSKQKTASCQYTVYFRSADDAGKTVKIEIYRSENTSFNLDSGTRVGSVNVGSKTAVHFAHDLP